jgi:solute carrier family 25 oxoglutarate transporter 11
MGSGAIAVCFGTPFDVALVRMQADSMKPLDQRRGYKNVVDALLRVYREEGFMKLYR